MKKWFRNENLIYLTVLALPTYLVRFSVFGIPTNILEVLISTIFIFWLVETRQYRRVETHCNASLRRGMLINKKYILPIGLIFLGLIISTIVNKNYAVGLGIIKSWFFFPLLLLVIVYSYFPKEKAINIFYALYGSVFLVALVSLGYLFFGSLTYDGRLESIFNSPNYLAMYLAPGIIIGVIMLAQYQKSGLRKKILYVSLAVILAAFYFTYSYAAWISVLVSLAIILILNKKFNRKYIIISVFIAATMFFLLKNTTKFNDLISLNQRSSLSSRAMIWQSAGKIIGDNWLIGIGPGNFQEKYLAYQKYFPPYLEWAVPHPHNLYLALWLYGGLLGILGFLGILVFFFFDLIKKDNNPIKFIALGIMLYILIHGMVDTTYFKNDLAVIFWLNFLVLI